MTFLPFKNESDVFAAGDLQIENRVDAIAVYGTLSIGRDKRGLDDARALRDILALIVAALEREPKLPAQAASNVKVASSVKNPFA